MSRTGYRPVFLCWIDGRPVTDLLAPILLSARVTDGVGIESDRVEITVDNRGGRLERPRKGAVLTCGGGFEGLGTKRFGTYEIEDSSVTLPLRQLTVTARASGVARTLKERKHRAFEDAKVKDLVEAVAKDAGLKAAIDPALAAIPIPYRAQLGESDGNLLSWLGRRLSAVATVKDGHLILAGKGASFAGIAEALPAITIGPDDLEGEEALVVRGCGRPRYGTVVAEWRDPAKGLTRLAKVGGGDARREATALISELFQSAEEAEAVAKARKSALERSEESLTATIVGRPDARAEAETVVSLGDRDADGTWSTESVTHEFDGSDVYRTLISAVRKGQD